MTIKTHRPSGWMAGLCAITLMVSLLVPAPVYAGGGAHVIDDASVETPGVCHLENWVTQFDQDRGLVNLSPACTRKVWPNLEIGASLQHSWDSGEDTTIGPALKYNLRPVERGLGVAVSMGGNWSIRSGQLETASLIVPVTIPIGDKVQVNLNGGWTYGSALEHQTAAFFGVQVLAQVTRDVSLMAEAFRRDHGRAGHQIGLRWNPRGGNVDIDILVGRRIDGVNPDAVTVGLTLRH
ncbi:hypothetical protein [Asticcacaulis benevestitus]|uniref:Transporter n=1 Tax=Asticcacaulis benevestitus DSM 16100 = ATCC BAA-896 TaxID=1121022 RepID=V4PYC5_9CAUL|nr:hypothetical protein [Asticcacaulis benevestitus]ESQ92439.1 hypothetical protein ABENE_08665 [Asticcacaulis benevestitus DSM 16100 = ATCC BAA-896]